MNPLTNKLAFDLLAATNKIEIMFDYEAKELTKIGLNEILTNEILKTK